MIWVQKNTDLFSVHMLAKICGMVLVWPASSPGLSHFLFISLEKCWLLLCVNMAVLFSFQPNKNHRVVTITPMYPTPSLFYQHPYLFKCPHHPQLFKVKLLTLPSSPCVYNPHSFCFIFSFNSSVILECQFNN